MKQSRRWFAKVLTAAAAAIPLMRASALGQATPPPETQKPQPEPPKEEAKPLIAALTGLVTAQYGEHLTEEDLTQVRTDFTNNLGGLERMRKFELVNSDEPDFSFSVEVRR